MNLGHKTWVFPDGDLPPRHPYDERLIDDRTHGHESLVVLNAGPSQIDPILHVYFTVDDPWEIALPSILPHRVRCYRLDEPLGESGRIIPMGQYALILACNAPVVAQIGRMDTRQTNLAYYTTLGFPA